MNTGRYLVAISYCLCIIVIGLMLGCGESTAEQFSDTEKMLSCIDREGTPVFKLGVYSHCAVESGKGWGEI